MSRRLLAVNLVLAVIVLAATAYIARALSAPRAVPVAAAPARAATALPGGAAAASPRGPEDAAPAARAEMRPLYSVIATKNLFSASRTEAGGAVPVAATPPPKLYLHGVVVDAAKSRAFIEDAGAKTTFGYAVGDTVGGGKLQVVRGDRVVIARPEGPMELMLRDPTKPQPAAPAAAAGTPGALSPAGRAAAVMPRAPQVPAAASGAPDAPAPAPVVGPRLMRPDLLRAPAAQRPPSDQ